ncbi:MAG: DUF4139 domain-containing protein [Chthoniobacterales bacterium]
MRASQSLGGLSVIGHPFRSVETKPATCASLRRGEGVKVGMSRLQLSLGVWWIFASCALAAEPGLTIYNHGFAIVRASVPLDLHKGENQIRFTDLTTQLEPDSVVLRGPKNRRDFRVLEQSYRADLATQTLLLNRFEGQTIDFLVEQPQKPDAIVSGKIIRGGSYGQPPLIEVNGKLRFDLPGKPLFPQLPNDTILKPELDWKIASEVAAKFDAEISYLSGGLSWSAGYNVIQPENGDTLEVIGSFAIVNQSGKDFANARTKLIAGNVNKESPTPQLKAMSAPNQRAFAAAAPAPVPAEALDDYHLYSLPQPLSLRDQESKQIEFMRAADVKSTSLYVFDSTGYEAPSPRPMGGPILDANWGVEGETKVAVVREIKNSEANHLGIPLPAGRWRFYRGDHDQQLEFTGEHEEEHTAKDETLRIFTGTAFDLAAERKQTDFSVDRAKHTMDEAFAITLRNHKKEPVDIHVVEHLNRWQSWEIVEHSADFTKRDAHTIEFVVRLKPDEEKVVNYRVRYTQLPTQ